MKKDNYMIKAIIASHRNAVDAIQQISSAAMVADPAFKEALAYRRAQVRQNAICLLFGIAAGSFLAIPLSYSGEFLVGTSFLIFLFFIFGIEQFLTGVKNVH